MTIIDTKPWLLDYLSQRSTKLEDNMLVQHETICKKLLPYFPNTDEIDIHEHLMEHGFFIPTEKDTTSISTFIKQNYWKQTKLYLDALQKKWKGPDVHVFVLPSDSTNPNLLQEFDGVSGVSHADKLFLFLPPELKTKKLQAVLTHEYNHICRLQQLGKPEESFTLLDTIVLEGIAEYAVEEELGSDFLSKWATLYSEEESQQHWIKFLSKHKHIKKGDMKHDALVYGADLTPPLAGYHCGYRIVKSFVKTEHLSVSELLALPSSTLLEQSTFD
ncbi:DUF2268 domain-containing protein [Radiobacillus kanasensis]|uniref:DUF2268 domain-containing protein n=1 Tax=Radiobacillus kanasensis TaxID=2844358 RepID=UPI001E3A69ED|nr:DUF2268 domain-containing putative Zn-dependent protease [Radiobacillus kanasensis]UFT99215.1 DUF2268 domain-containing protein [Radiobacillus kanasensis]